MIYEKNQRQIKKNVSLKKYSTFGIGGEAAYFFEAHSVDDLLFSLKFAKENSLPVFILGKGSNILFDDRGYKGLVILNKLQSIQYEDSIVTVGSGESFSLLGIRTAKKGFSGLEFASGIPGTVGGAVFMNAGAAGSDVSKVLKEVSFIEEDLNIKTFSNEQACFSYRTSIFQKKRAVIISASFFLTPSDTAREKQKNDLEYRLKTQPYNIKSAGCAFRNPMKASAGFLIEDAGLKNMRVGGAFVSNKHANFIVNKGEATSSDVLKLIELVQREVLLRHNIELECEVRYIPYE